MGFIELPSSGRVYVDSQVLIYTLEHHPRYEPLLEPLWRAAVNEGLEVVTSELALLETLIAPLRNGDAALQNDYERALIQTDLSLLPISQPVLREAARLWALIPGLRTPDAIHGATALLHQAALFVTNDRDFRRIPKLPLAILDDIA